MNATITDESMRTSGSVSIEIDADAGMVYDLISDVTRIGEWSPECRRANWLDGEAGPAVGVRFKGHNKWKMSRWARICEIVAAEPGREFAFWTIPGHGPSADSTTWRWDIETAGDVTRVTQSYEITKMPQRWFLPIVKRFMPHHLDMRDHIRQTLEALKTTAEQDG